MNRMEKYYEIIERPSTEVNKIWKMTHISFLTAACCFGFGASYAFAAVMDHFRDNCWLYPNIAYRHALQNVSLFLNYSYEIKIDLVSTQWGPPQTCNYVQYVPLMSVLLGAILIAFFIVFPRGGTNYNQSSSVQQSWIIVMPSIFVSFIYIIFLLLCFSTFSKGANAFCLQFDEIIDSSNSDQCNKLIEKFTQELSDDFPGINSNNPSVSTKIALALSFLCFCILSWILEILSLILRVIYAVDFKILEVTIESTEDKIQKTELTIEHIYDSDSTTDSSNSDTSTIETE